jgi:hypothetical protein
MTHDADSENEVKELMGLFDAPSFVRRGQDVESSIRRLHDRCRVCRGRLLEMVRLRLRQWSRAVTGPEAWSGVFTAPIDALWALSEAENPQWAATAAPLRRQRAIATDLVASTLRFNARWTRFLVHLNIDPTNAVIDLYNRYYLLEKECVVGSARLAARHFTPVAPLTKETLFCNHPLLPVPVLVGHQSFTTGDTGGSERRTNADRRRTKDER